MEIRFFGGKTLFLKGKQEGLLLNPGENLIKKNQSRIVIFSDPSDDFLGLETERVVIKGPGEYEIGGIEVTGLKEIYVVNIDGVLIGVLLDTSVAEKEVESAGGVDVLIVDVSQGAKEILGVAKKLGVNYVLPMGFVEKDDKLKSFLDEFDEEELEAVESLKVERGNLPEGMEVVVLKKSE